MQFVIFEDIDGREVRVNPLQVAALCQRNETTTEIVLSGQRLTVRGTAVEVEARLSEAEPPPAPDPTLALLS